MKSISDYFTPAKTDFDIRMDRFESVNHPTRSGRMSAMIGSMKKALAKAKDDDIRRMLGLWVSEIEPEIWFDHSGALIGLSYKGYGRVIIPATKITFEFVPNDYPEGA